MKRLTCEMCGSTDLMKQDGVFVCQSCGCKYSVEEARKMMVEGTVDVSGSTVKVDNSDFVQKCLVNARNAKQREDWEETEKYYSLVEQNNPGNIEAIFYSTYGKARCSLRDGDLNKRKAVFNSLKNCVSLFDNHFVIEKADELKELLEKISADIIALSASSYVYNCKKTKDGKETWSDRMDTETLFNTLGMEFMISLENIANKYSGLTNPQRLYYYRLALKQAEWTLKHGSLAKPQGYRDIIATYHKWINAIYWDAHADEKAALEAEKATLEKQISSIQEEIDRIPGNAELDAIQSRISTLSRQLHSLGLFKGRQKEALQKEIDAAYAEKNEIVHRMDVARQKIKNEMHPLQWRINGINTELTKER